MTQTGVYQALAPLVPWRSLAALEKKTAATRWPHLRPTGTHPCCVCLSVELCLYRAVVYPCESSPLALYPVLANWSALFCLFRSFSSNRLGVWFMCVTRVCGGGREGGVEKGGAAREPSSQTQVQAAENQNRLFLRGRFFDDAKKSTILPLFPRSAPLLITRRHV